MNEETIAALSTPPGRGGIGVIRISGPEAEAIIRQIAPAFPHEPVDRRMYHVTISPDGKQIDEGLATLFRSPNSYTGEDLVELSLHGNPLIIEKVLDGIFSRGARQATPGEFTYRAFSNGKIDLIQAEAVNELIQSASAFHAGLVFSHLQGKFSVQIAAIRERLVDLGVAIETMIEFQEDQHLETIRIGEDLGDIRGMITQILSHSGLNETLNRERQVVILGRVNVGKSSLFNALLGHDRAIVSDVPGTTRDVITERIFFNSQPLELVDIAGSQEGSINPLEQEGIRRGGAMLDSCDAVILILDVSTPLLPVDLDLYNRIKDKPRLIVINKMDIADTDVLADLEERFADETPVKLSARTGDGLQPVFSFLRSTVWSNDPDEVQWSISQRQKGILEETGNRLERLHHRFESSPPAVIQSSAELVAEDIRDLLKLIGQLTGEVTDQEILEGIFERFCIGK